MRTNLAESMSFEEKLVHISNCLTENLGCARLRLIGRTGYLLVMRYQQINLLCSADVSHG